jgi:hypothetical protein
VTIDRDIDRLLAAAADDTDRPLTTDVDEVLARARRSVRRSRIATLSTAVLTTAVIVAGAATWSANRGDTVAPAGDPGITVDPKSGQVIDNETRTAALPPPAVSPLSDAEVLRRCRPYDVEYVESMKERGGNAFDRTGPIDNRWTVVVKSSDQQRLQALFLAPDRSVVSTCTMDGPDKPKVHGRYSTTQGFPGKSASGSADDRPQTVISNVQIPVNDVARVLVDLLDEKAPRQALVGTDGFISLGYPNWEPYKFVKLPDGTERPQPAVQRVRAYDAAGRRIYDWKYQPVELPKEPSVPADRTIEVPEPITPQVVLTKDPETGKPLHPMPPVSPVSDDSIRTRCEKPDASYLKGRRTNQDPRTYDAGPISPDWKVALKTGTGTDFTALLVSPGNNVVMWCHMYTDSDMYDYSRVAVPANGTFGIGMEWGQVPDGVAQIVLDLPTGPVSALVSNGYFIWATTGGNSDIRNVRIRGFDAQGKQVYDQKHQIDVS